MLISPLIKGKNLDVDFCKQQNLIQKAFDANNLAICIVLPIGIYLAYLTLALVE